MGIETIVVVHFALALIYPRNIRPAAILRSFIHFLLHRPVDDIRESDKKLSPTFVRSSLALLNMARVGE